MRALPLMLALLVAACGGSDIDEVDLALSSSSCTAPELGALRSVSVEVYGFDVIDGRETQCTLRRRCISVEGLASMEDLDAVLRAAPQPLVDSPRDGVEAVAVTGYLQIGCGDSDRGMCGQTDLRDADDGVLAVRLTCQASACPDAVPLCLAGP